MYYVQTEYHLSEPKHLQRREFTVSRNPWPEDRLRTVCNDVLRQQKAFECFEAALAYGASQIGSPEHLFVQGSIDRGDSVCRPWLGYSDAETVAMSGGRNSYAHVTPSSSAGEG